MLDFTFKDAFDVEWSVSVSGGLASVQTEAKASGSLLQLHAQHTVCSHLHHYGTHRGTFM